MDKQIQEILKRNKRVETDKARETSMTRRIIISLITYLIAGIFLTSIQAPNPWLNALVPMMGFILSTLTLPFIKTLRIKRIYNNKE